MARQPENHPSLWRQRRGGDNCLNMPQLALTQCIPIHPHSRKHSGLLAVRLKWNLHVHPRHPLTPHCPIWNALFQQLFGPFSPTISLQKTVNPKAAAPLPWMSPNPFSLGLSISSCRVRNTLPRCHYCTITYQIPPVYYHYRIVSAIINYSSTPAGERDYWLTEEVRRLRIAQALPVFFLLLDFKIL